MKKPLKLNIGCGETKLKGFINIDTEKKVKPDIKMDVRNTTLPFRDNSVDLIHCIHNIEHIERKYWPIVFSEFWRVLKPKSKVILAYPEFGVCASYFLNNFRGEREFWRATLYGRQLYPGDFHVTPMHTPDFIDYLVKNGFTNIRHKPEEGEEYNTFLTCEKGNKVISREDIIRKEIFRK